MEASPIASATRLVGGRLAEVALHVREPRRRSGRTPPRRAVSPVPTIESRARCAQLLVGPVVDRDADDRAVEQPALLEPVERAEGHHLREVAGDAEDDEDVCGAGRAGSRAAFDVCGVGSALVVIVLSSVAVVVRVHGDAAGTLVREHGAGPVDDRLRAVLVGREEREVHRSPGELGRLALHRAAAEHLDDRRAASDRRHRALVVVLERLGFLAREAPGDRLAGVLPTAAPPSRAGGGPGRSSRR